MGVDGFHSFLREQGLERQLSGKPIPVAMIVVDLADILHTNARHASNADQLLKQSVQKIHSLLKHLKLEGGGKLAIFMDGPAPLAKLSTQIKRRRTQAARISSEKQKQKGKRGGMSGLWLSPGTRVTDSLEAGLRASFPKAVISGCREPGEGEIKAVDFLLQRADKLVGKKIAFVGGDADLVLIASAASPLTNMIVVHGKEGGKGFVSVSVDSFWKKCKGIPREDICVLATMTGNDYLPKFAGFNMKTLLHRYKSNKVTGGIVGMGGCLRAAALHALVKSCRDTTPPKPGARCACAQLPEGHECSPAHYFSGIAWCLKMYSTGDCPNVDYVYSSNAPCAAKSIAYLEYLLGENPNATIVPSRDDTALPLSCDQALLLLIPSWGVSVMPTRLRQYMAHPELVHWYPPSCKVCDEYSVRRGVMLKEKAELLDILKATKGDEEVSADIQAAVDAAKVKESEFNEEYISHLRTAHPALPPPVDVVRRLLGGSGTNRAKGGAARDKTSKKALKPQEHQQVDQLVSTKVPGGHAKSMRGADYISPEQIEICRPGLERMMIRMLGDDRFVDLIHKQFVSSASMQNMQ
jgi:hypothetical protein